MEPIRRRALVKATIEEVGRSGSLDVTVARIARRAGMSSALAHHYFGGKEDIFLASMRHILTVFGAAVRGALATARTPEERVRAIIRASFEAGNFHPHVISAWLNFYVHAECSPEAARLLRVYQRRLHSNLVHALRPLVGDRAGEAAEAIAALIDGVYLRHALRERPARPAEAVQLVEGHLDLLLAGGGR